MINVAEFTVDLGFFTMSPSLYTAAEVVGVAAILLWAAESLVELSSEHPAKKTPATRRAMIAGITQADVFIMNCTSSPYKNRYDPTDVSFNSG